MKTTTSLWISRILASLVGLFLLMDAVMKLLRLPPVLAALTALGWPVALSVPLGVLLLVCIVLYLVPRTAMLGAILLTGYLGGAAAAHVRLGNPLFSNVLFPVYLGVALWLALWLRVPGLRALLSGPGTFANHEVSKEQ